VGHAAAAAVDDDDDAMIEMVSFPRANYHYALGVSKPLSSAEDEKRKRLVLRLIGGNRSLMHGEREGEVGSENRMFVYVHQGRRDDCVNLDCLFLVQIRTQ
jgi:hypothetical protein